MRGQISRFFPRRRRDEIFALAADVEAYPEFLPLCRRARIVERREGGLRVVQQFGARPLTLCFETEAHLSPPDGLSIRSRDPAFRRFCIDWRFVDEPGGCRALCDVDLEFQHPALEMAARLSAGSAMAAVAAAFARRAAAQKGGA